MITVYSGKCKLFKHLTETYDQISTYRQLRCKTYKTKDKVMFTVSTIWTSSSMCSPDRL